MWRPTLWNVSFCKPGIVVFKYRMKVIVRSNMNCKTKNIIYCMICGVCWKTTCTSDKLDRKYPTKYVSINDPCFFAKHSMQPALWHMRPRTFQLCSIQEKEHTRRVKKPQYFILIYIYVYNIWTHFCPGPSLLTI
jgi:hypothetical protein